MLGSGLDLGVREIGEMERDFGRSSDNICKEYVVRPLLEVMVTPELEGDEW